MPAAVSASSQSPVHGRVGGLHAVVGGQQHDGLLDQPALLEQVEPDAEPARRRRAAAARAIGEPGPPAWWPESVSVVFHHMSARRLLGAPETEHLLQPAGVDLASPSGSPAVGHVVLRGERVVGGCGQPVAQRAGAVARAAVADQREGAVVRAGVDRLVDAGAAGAGRQPLEDGPHARPQPVHGAVPRGRAVRHDLLAGDPVVEGVVDDAVPPRTDTGQRAGVVDQRDARELRDRSAAQRAAAGEQPGDVRQGAVGGQREQLGARRAVPQQADDVPRRRGRRRPAAGPSMPSRSPPARCVRVAPTSTVRATRVDGPALAHPGAGQHQGGPRLQAVQRPVLAEVAAAVGPAVGPGVHDGEVGGARVGEQRVQPDGRERVGGRAVAERVLVGDRVATGQQGRRALGRQRDVALAVGDVDEAPSPASRPGRRRARAPGRAGRRARGRAGPG